MKRKRNMKEVKIIEDKKLKKAVQEEKREYFRRWRKNNPDKVKKHNDNYWLKRTQKRLEAEDEATTE